MKRHSGIAPNEGPVGSRWHQAWQLLPLWLLMLVPPVVIFVTAKDSFRLPKLLVAETLALASLGWLSVRLRSIERIDWRRLGRHPLVQTGAAILVAAALGLLASPHPMHVRHALPSLAIGVGCLLGWSLALRAVEARRLLTALLVPAVFLALFAVLQHFDLYDPFGFRGRIGDRLALTSLAGGAFDLSAFLVLPALLLQDGLRRARGRRRALFAVLLLVVVAGVLVTETLASALALAAGSLLYWWLVGAGRRKWIATGVAVLIGTVMLVATTSTLRGRFVNKARQLARGEINQVLTGRLDAWRAATWMLGQRPLTGVGQGAYRAEFGHARVELTAAGVEFYPRHRQPYFVNAHSDVLEALAEWGLVGGVALAFGLWRLVMRLRQRWRDGHQAGEVGEPSLLIAAVAAFAVLALVWFPLHLAIVAYPGLLLLVWIFAPQETGE